MVQQGEVGFSGRSRTAVAAGAGVLAGGLVATGVLAAPPAARHTAAAAPISRLAAAVLPFDEQLAQLGVEIGGAVLPEVAAAASWSISDAIIAVYITVEEWVQYGVNLLSWALRWVPFGGLLAGQLNIFYDFNEAIVRSVVFNTAYLLDGTVGFGEAVSNVAGATTAAIGAFFDDQLAWLRGLLPPLPPLAALDPTVLNPAALDPTVLDPTVLGGFLDPGATPDVVPDIADGWLTLAP